MNTGILFLTGHLIPAKPFHTRREMLLAHSWRYYIQDSFSCEVLTLNSLLLWKPEIAWFNVITCFCVYRQICFVTACSVLFIKFIYLINCFDAQSKWMILGYLSCNFHITSVRSFNEIDDTGLVLKRALFTRESNLLKNNFVKLNYAKKYTQWERKVVLP